MYQLTLSQMTNFKTGPHSDDKLIPIQKLKSVHGGEENIVGKGENAGYQHFLLFPHCFQKLSYLEVIKVGIMW